MQLVAIADGKTTIEILDHTDCDLGDAVTGPATYTEKVTINGNLKLVLDGDSTNTHINAKSDGDCKLTHAGTVKANQAKVFIGGIPVAVLDDVVTDCGVIGGLAPGVEHSVRINV